MQDLSFINIKTHVQNMILTSTEKIIKKKKELAVSTAQLDIFPKELQDIVICPISMSIMVEPVIASDGHTYDKSAILNYMESCDVPLSPMTKKKLTPNLIVNYSVQNIIFSYIPYENVICNDDDFGNDIYSDEESSESTEIEYNNFENNWNEGGNDDDDDDNEDSEGSGEEFADGNDQNQRDLPFDDMLF